MNKSFQCLFLVDFKALYVTTTKDYVNSFSKYSSIKHHICDYRILKFKNFLINKYDVISIHWSVDLHSNSTINIIKSIERYNGLKVIFRQDEYRNVRRIENQILKLKFNIFFSCIPKKQINKVYSKTFLKKIKVKNILTSYVPEYFKRFKHIAYDERPYLVGYRGREVNFCLGKQGQEKKEIGDLFKKSSQTSNLNVTSKENKRIYGNYWFSFLSKCKSVLGTESGSSIIDYDGSIELKLEKLKKKNPNLDFNNYYEKFLKNLDGKRRINTISGRLFEAAACHSLLILYEGEYNNIFKKWVHYVPLKKNGSNLHKILEILKNTDYCKKIIKQTFSDIILKDKYSYKNFIKDFDTEILGNLKFPKKGNIFFNRFLNFFYIIYFRIYNFFIFLIPKKIKIYLKCKFLNYN